MAESAVLCPSFWRADIVHNPSWWDRTLAKLRGGIVGWLQRRRAARVLTA
jgi:indolepyruvate ferredoxin oxidoreductase alpha subunit